MKWLFAILAVGWLYWHFGKVQQRRRSAGGPTTPAPNSNVTVGRYISRKTTVMGQSRPSSAGLPGGRFTSSRPGIFGMGQVNPSGDLVDIDTPPPVATVVPQGANVATLRANWRAPLVSRG